MNVAVEFDTERAMEKVRYRGLICNTDGGVVVARALGLSSS